jgi:GT2 family glycosyltransferase
VVNAEFILSIDDDTRVSYEILRDLPGLMRKRYPQVGILALRVLHFKTNEDQNHYGEQERLVANHHGAACMIRREVLSRVGGIDDNCTFGSEEIDLCIRAHAAGFEILYTPELVVFHNNIVQQGNAFLGRVKMRVFNNARTMHKYFSLPMANRFANRYLGRMSLGWIIKKDVASLGSLVFESLRGRYFGLLHRTPVPPATAAYYTDPNLVPAFGNTPFFHPLIRRHLLKSCSAKKVNVVTPNDNP